MATDNSRVTVSMEPVAWVMRIHPDGGSFREASPFNTSCTVTADDNMVGTIRGFSGGVTTEVQRAIFAEMARNGIKEVLWSRRIPGKKWRSFRYPCV